MRLWGGRFEGGNDERMAEFNRSIDFDCALAVDDIAGSIAHVHGLGRAGLLTSDEVEKLVAGLEGLRGEAEAGTLEWNTELEDIHLNLEVALKERIGPLAGKMHTGRSTTRSRPTFASGCAEHWTRSTARSWRWSGPWSAWPIAKAARSCQA
jgi:argininosuccinate lyase